MIRLGRTATFGVAFGAAALSAVLAFAAGPEATRKSPSSPGAAQTGVTQVPASAPLATVSPTIQQLTPPKLLITSPKPGAVFHIGWQNKVTWTRETPPNPLYNTVKMIFSREETGGYGVPKTFKVYEETTENDGTYELNLQAHPQLKVPGKYFVEIETADGKARTGGPPLWFYTMAI